MRYTQIPQRVNGEGKGPLFILFFLPLSPVRFPHSKLISASGPLHLPFLMQGPHFHQIFTWLPPSHTQVLAQISPLQRALLISTPHTQLKPVMTIQPPSIPLPCLLSSQCLLSEVILILVCYLLTCSLAVSPRHREAAKGSAWHIAGA